MAPRHGQFNLALNYERSPHARSAETQNGLDSQNLRTLKRSVKAVVRGTHRSRSLEHTLEIAQNIAPDLGITRLANVTGLDRVGIPVVMAVRPNSRSLAVSQGKGLTLVAAKASAIMESIESYVAERVESLLLYATYAELLNRAEAVVDVDSLPSRMSGPYPRDAMNLWIKGHDLLQNEDVWVPFEIVHLNYTVPQVTGTGWFAQSSNGLASGNDFFEAMCHGACEVIERDASSLHFYQAETHGTPLALDSVDDPDCVTILKKFDEADIDVRVWDITSDVGIPTFHCDIFDPVSGRVPFKRSATGIGTHLSKAIALSRALTEAAQSRLTIIAGSRDDILRAGYDATLEEAPPAIPPESRKRDFRVVDSLATDSLQNDLSYIVSRLAKSGIKRCIAVTLSEPAFPFSVVRAVIPGLEGPHTIRDIVPNVRERAGLGAAR